MSQSVFWLVLALIFSVFAQAQEEKRKERRLYFGSESTEAEMSFTYSVQFESTERPNKLQVEDKIHEQLRHLFGPMGEATYIAVPKGDHQISFNLQNLTEENGVYRQSYQYKGTIVVKLGVEAQYDVMLPRNPDTIFDESEYPKGSGKYPCTDPSYQGRDSFWYFWNPRKNACKPVLVAGVHYDTIKTSIVRKENTKSTYPEYNRLVQIQNGQKVIPISVLMGMDKPYSKSPDPVKSKGTSKDDVNAPNYRDIRRQLLSGMGFSVTRWSQADIDHFVELKTWGPTPYVEVFTKKVKDITLVVRVLFGHAGISEESRNFHVFLKKSLASDSAMIYDGHAGLGHNVNLNDIENTEGFGPIVLNQDQYQILFFNSCTSYAYYNTMYFARKRNSIDIKGTRNLDILTNGLATAFDVGHDTNMGPVKAIYNWASGTGSLSYQVMAKQIDSLNLFGVNGDEDNPTQPQ